MADSAWVDVGELLEPLTELISAAVDVPGDTDRPPAAGPPSFVTHTISTTRTEEGATRWGVLVKSLGAAKGIPVAQQARLVGDRIARWLCDHDSAGVYVNAIALEGVEVLARESNGDGHEELGEVTDEWVEGFTLTVQRA